MRVLMTGATGFIGGHLCARLTERGDEVTALARSRRKASALPAAVRILEGDLSLFADPATELPAFDVVIHLAGVVAAEHPEQYEAINYTAVKDLVSCLGRQPWKPARMLFASSLAAAGPSPRGTALTELDPLQPIDPYGDAKARAEVVVREAPFPTTSFRPAIVLGPGDEASLTLYRSARSGVGFRVAGAPQELSFIDVRDLVTAIVLMADDRRPGSYDYFASHPTAIDTRVLWRELERAVGHKVRVAPVPRWALYVAMMAARGAAAIVPFKNQLDAKQYAQMVAPAFVCSSERLRTELGWAPLHDLADTLAHAAAGYRASGALRA